MNTLGISIYRWLMRFLHMQLFITLGSLPILIYWGLPVSIMSPVGNLLFTPFLMAFLLLSSAIFFLELLCIPNGYLAYLLEKTVEWWSWTLKYNCSTWLLSFAKPSIIFFIALLGATFFIVHHKKLSSPPRSIIGFSLLLMITFGYLKLKSTHIHYLAVPCNNGALSIVRDQNKTVLIDPGVLGQRSSSTSWIEYTLLPELNKAFGTNTIDHLVIMQPGTLTLEAIANICNQTMVNTIHLISWQGTAQKSFYRNYGIMKKIVQEKNVKIYRLGKRKHNIKLSDASCITILPLEKTLHYQDCTFPALQARIEIDNQEINIYSAKMKNGL